MTDKVTLADLSSLSNATTAITTLNSNSAAITTAMNNTLSRDGTSPNSMGANLDMNSNRIVNLPAPVALTEPARLQDIQNLEAGQVVTVNNLPAGGNQNQVLIKNSGTDFDVSWAGPTSTTINNDTNVTLAISGSTALAAASSLTVAWAGTLDNSRLANVNNNTVKGNVSGTSAAPSDLTKTQLTTLINTFTSSLSGAAPASGGGTINFLRADGSWTTSALPTVQIFTSTSNTSYTPTSGVTKIKVQMIGGGGGGGAQATNSGGAGGTSTFQVNSTGTAWSCPGGGGGAPNNGNGGTAGAAVTAGSSGVQIFTVQGVVGTKGDNNANGTGSGGGAGSFFGPGGPVGPFTSAGVTATTYGAGGGGANGSGAAAMGGGGGSGTYVQFWATVTTSCVIAVGTAGAAATAGTVAGGAGGTGAIIIEEYYF